jgi:hypothetical protein
MRIKKYFPLEFVKVSYNIQLAGKYVIINIKIDNHGYHIQMKYASTTGKLVSRDVIYLGCGREVFGESTAGLKGIRSLIDQNLFLFIVCLATVSIAQIM